MQWNAALKFIFQLNTYATTQIIAHVNVCHGYACILQQLPLTLFGCVLLWSALHAAPATLSITVRPSWAPEFPVSACATSTRVICGIPSDCLGTTIGTSTRPRSNEKDVRYATSMYNVLHFVCGRGTHGGFPFLSKAYYRSSKKHPV